LQDDGVVEEQVSTRIVVLEVIDLDSYEFQYCVFELEDLDPPPRRVVLALPAIDQRLQVVPHSTDIFPPTDQVSTLVHEASILFWRHYNIQVRRARF